jgi:kumamolisin
VKLSILGISILSLAACTALYAQEAESVQSVLPPRLYSGGQAIVPTSSIAHPEDAGQRMHTNFMLFVPSKPPAGSAVEPRATRNTSNTPATGYYYETPQTLACLYGLVAWTAGCNPYTMSNTSPHAVGGSKAIAIVDAYDYPTALNDLTKYSAQFGLPAPSASTFTKVYATGTNPGPDPTCAGGNGWNCWSAEESLDTEMAHAMAPSAHIYLVEAASNSFANLNAAVAKAVSLLTTAPNTGGEVSMSYGGGEFSGETSEDSAYTGKNVVFFASTGDHEGVEYPSASPNVVAVGGTTLSRSPYSLAIESEISWEDGGGGYSQYEPVPSYQTALFGAGAARAVPDVAAIGNPRTGVWVYNSYQTANLIGVPNWLIFGGTSVASPLMAGIVNHAAHFSASTSAEETVLYSNGLFSPNLRDVTYGSCGYYEGWFAGEGWDPCTGLGAPYGILGK